ncbi:adenylyl-sulfate kinase [Paenibacillus sp. J45TS6]|uniref:adenylyl-sulfate kinase n=1 Tax=unclassified Paenibacillus TaxID=185978 RepID=UPI001B1943F4|nr:adenylyl-sulfate kinase [Paenibacillus sp. J45TS6]GIP43227.1 adenylyl-sulfate kinase [Paenibacillus sp. J45TS6]
MESIKKINFTNPKVIWLTGLSGSGKTTLATHLKEVLMEHDYPCYILDGDQVRKGLNQDLGFSPADRKENLRRIGEVSKLFLDAGLFVIAAFISPHEEDRQMVKKMFEPGQFVEVYVNCSLEECEARDPKGLYLKARKGEILHFTGVSAPYEIPNKPDIIIDTELLDIKNSVAKLLQELDKL